MNKSLQKIILFAALLAFVLPTQVLAALQYVGGTKGNRTGSTSAGITLTLNSGLTGGSGSAAAAGDIVVIVQSTGSAADRALTMSTAGYTGLNERYANGTTYDTNFEVYWKIMGSSPDASAVTGPSGSTADGQSATAQVWRFVNQATPMDVASTSNSGTGTGRPTPPAITPTTAGAIIIATGAGAAGAGVAYTTASLSNFNAAAPGADTNDSMTAMGSFAWSSGAYTPAQFGGGTTNAADSWVSQTLVLRPAVIPTVTTQAEADITKVSATVNGNITVTGNAYAGVTVRGFAWGTNSALSGGDTATTTDTAGQPFGTGAFTGSITSLTCNTTYYSRPYATNGVGDGLGSIDSFVTSPCPPTVTTQAESGVTETSATVNGTISATGGANATVRGFAWGTDAALSGGDTATTTDTAGQPFGTGAFTGSLTSLTCNTTYYSRPYATNSGGDGLGTIDSFVTSACPATPPTVVTNQESSVTQTSATLNGNISATGGQNSTVRGFAWGTDSTLVTAATTTENGSWGTGAFTYGATLTCNTTYYARAYATNPGGTGLGSIDSFTSSPCAPTVTTQSASSVSTTTAVFNGNITVTGGSNATVRGFAWGTSSTMLGDTATTSNDTGSFGTGAFNTTPSPHTGLTCNTTYYTRAYATGPGGTGLGAISSSFTTNACAPTVTTQAASSVGQTNATLNGNITVTGGANAGTRGFAWGTNASLSGGDTATTTENGSFTTGAFTDSAQTFVCNTTYYSRAYATGPGGTSFGAISSSFTTGACSTIELSAYRFFESSLAYAPGAALAAQDNSATLASSGDSFRMRTLLHVGVGEVALSGKAFKLQLSLKSGTCDSGFTGENYVDVTGVTAISYKDTAGLTDNNALGAAGDITHGADIIVNQTYEEANNFTNSQSSVPAGQDGKWDFSLYDNGGTPGASYCLRVVNSDGSNINTYPAVLPEIAIPAGAPALSQTHYRWRSDDGNEVLASYVAAEDTPVSSGVYTGDRRRLRFLIDNSGPGSAAGYTYLLEHASSTCTTWLSVPTSATLGNQHWVMDVSPHVADSGDTTHSSGMTSPGGSFTAGYLQTANNQTSTHALPAGNYTELEYSVRSTSNITPGTLYCFRLTNGGSTTYFTYTVQPQITIQPNSSKPVGGGGGNGGGEVNGNGAPVGGGGAGGGGGGEGSGGGPPAGGGGAGGGGGDSG